MHSATLLRLEHNETETLGVLLLDNTLVGYTLELPWRNNEEDISRIPIGGYICQYEYSPRFEEKFYELKAVEDRSEILIHVGNTHLDTVGCILLGQRQGYLEGTRAILDSRKAIDNFHDILDGESIKLRIFSYREYTQGRLPTVDYRS